MQKFWYFMQYHNAVPILLFVLFGGTGVALAATPQVRSAVYDSQEEVQAVDNTYIVSVNLDNRDFGLQITNIAEDNDSYYITYTYNTINVIDYVWKEVSVTKTAQFSKKELEGHDLGLFLAKQLGEEITAQKQYLAQVQKQEREKGASVKTIATKYSGLVGRMLSPTEKKFAGYTPVVAEAPITSGASASAAVALGESHDASAPPIDVGAIVSAAVAKALAAQQNQIANSSSVASNNPDDTQNTNTSGGSSGSGAPTLTIRGKNPATVNVGDSYSDLGATVTDDKDDNLAIHASVDNGNDIDLSSVTLDTSVAGTHTIKYSSIDNDGNATTATRTVKVLAPASVTPSPATTTPPVENSPEATSTSSIVTSSATTTLPPDALPTQTPPAETPSDPVSSTTPAS